MYRCEGCRRILRRFRAFRGPRECLACHRAGRPARLRTRVTPVSGGLSDRARDRRGAAHGLHGDPAAAGNDRRSGRARRRSGNARNRRLHSGQPHLRDPCGRLCGGSAFGLAASTGVSAWLRERGVGFSIGPARVPIVAGAVLFDLAVGDPEAYPDEAMGRAACDPPRLGRRGETGPVGAGAGATVGKLLGVARASRGGVGVAAVVLPGGEIVAALAAVNAFGDVVDPDTGQLLAGPERRRFRTERALREDELAKALWRRAHHARLHRDDHALRHRGTQAGGDGGPRRPGPVGPAHAHDRRRRRRLCAGAGRRRLSRLRAGAAAAHSRPTRSPPRSGMTSERRGILLVAAAALLWSTGGIGISGSTSHP